MTESTSNKPTLFARWMGYHYTLGGGAMGFGEPRLRGWWKLLGYIESGNLALRTEGDEVTHRWVK